MQGHIFLKIRRRFGVSVILFRRSITPNPECLSDYPPGQPILIYKNFSRLPNFKTIKPHISYKVLKIRSTLVLHRKRTPGSLPMSTTKSTSKMKQKHYDVESIAKLRNLFAFIKFGLLFQTLCPVFFLVVILSLVSDWPEAIDCIFLLTVDDVQIAFGHAKGTVTEQ